MFQSNENADNNSRVDDVPETPAETTEAGIVPGLYANRWPMKKSGSLPNLFATEVIRRPNPCPSCRQLPNSGIGLLAKTCSQSPHSNGPLSSNRQHYEIDDCLEDNRED